MSYYTAGDYYMAGGALDDFLRGGGFAENPSASGYPAALPSAAGGGGYHVPKSWGTIPGTGTPSPFYGGRRRYRRTNVLNPRALRRAMRRVGGFAKFARKTMTFVQHHKMKKHRRR